MATPSDEKIRLVLQAAHPAGVLGTARATSWLLRADNSTRDPTSPAPARAGASACFAAGGKRGEQGQRATLAWVYSGWKMTAICKRVLVCGDLTRRDHGYGSSYYAKQ